MYHFSDLKVNLARKLGRNKGKWHFYTCNRYVSINLKLDFCFCIRLRDNQMFPFNGNPFYIVQDIFLKIHYLNQWVYL